jgi:hypothetical protein
MNIQNLSNEKKVAIRFLKLPTIIILIILFLSFVQNDGYIPEKGFVPDEATAIKIAEAILIPIYGSEIYKEEPFNAILKDSTVWIIEGTLHADVGGVAYIEIRKSDCKILKVKHGK